MHSKIIPHIRFPILESHSFFSLSPSPQKAEQEWLQILFLSLSSMCQECCCIYLLRDISSLAPDYKAFNFSEEEREREKKKLWQRLHFLPPPHVAVCEEKRWNIFLQQGVRKTCFISLKYCLNFALKNLLWGIFCKNCRLFLGSITR